MSTPLPLPKIEATESVQNSFQNADLSHLHSTFPSESYSMTPVGFGSGYSSQAQSFIHIKVVPDDLVTYDGEDDPYSPLNWPRKRKIITTILYGLTTAGSTWMSSVYSPATDAIAEEFGVGIEVSTLGTTLFMFGFGLGPLIWAPLSEVYGRKLAVFPPYFIAAMFCFGTATAKDIQTVIITRFFAGFFSAAPVSNTGGVLADIWPASQRGVAVLLYSISVKTFPLFGSIAGTAIVEQSAFGWRWTHYVTGIMMLVISLVDICTLSESYSPVLLVYKAQRLRRETRNWALHAEFEEYDISIEGIVQKFLIRPFQLLATPICFFVVLYASFVYGLVYLNFSAFPIEFEEIRHWSPVVASLPFLAIVIGCVLGALASFLNQGFYLKHLAANHNKPVPEARLPVMMMGSLVLPAGLFIFAWTSSPEIHWIGSCVGAALMGFGIFAIFQGATNYLVDTFQQYGASAMAANTLVRNIFAGTFPLFTNDMFHTLGVKWATSLLGSAAVALIPIPFVFYIYGKRIRIRGKWSRDSAI